MNDLLQRLDNLAGEGEWCSPLAQEAADRVRELEAELEAVKESWRTLRVNGQRVGDIVSERDFARGLVDGVTLRAEDAERERNSFKAKLFAEEEEHNATMAEVERLRQALKQFAECDLNDSNCSGLPVAVARIRNIARAALAGEKP